MGPWIHVILFSMSEKKNPNPSGRAGKPIEVPEMDFDDALRKILGAGKPAEPKPTSTKKKPSKSTQR